MKVSICCITYNHEAFIAETLDGFLMQRTTFPIEIIVHDDASTDGTAAIIREYAARDNRIQAILRTTNIRSTGVPVFPITYALAKGKYIALCEGDDYWTDANKLQRQVDALENDPEAAACFTNAYNEREGIRTEYLDGTYTKRPGRIVQQSELVNGQGLPTCTVLLRRSAMLPLPKAYAQAPTGDTLLYAHASNAGHFIFLPIFTGVRRMHAGGIHSLSSLAHKYLTTLRNLPFLDEASHFRHHDLITDRQERTVKAGWALSQKVGHLDLARYCWPLMARMRKKVGWSIPTTARNYLKAYWPRAEKWAGSIWDGLSGRSRSAHVDS